MLKWPAPETELCIYFASLLYQYGYKNVSVVDGDLGEWIAKGYSLQSKFLGEIKVTKSIEQVNRKN